MKKLILIFALVLVGCNGTLPENPVAVPEDTKTVEVDRRLLQACTEPTRLASGKDTDNLAFTEATLTALAECGVRHKGLVDVVKRAFNIKD